MDNWHTIINHGPAMIEVYVENDTGDTLAAGEKIHCVRPPARIKIIGNKSAHFECLQGLK